jgi:hypothetical protein
MYSDLESDQRKREEVISSLYWSLMQNWDIPKSIYDHYGFTEDYRLFHQLEELEPAEYKRKRETGEVPDILEVDARLTRTVEKVFESLCGKPPAPYLDKMNEELEKLGQIAALPDSVHPPYHSCLSRQVRYRQKCLCHGTLLSSGESISGTGCQVCEDDRTQTVCR